MSLRKKSEGIEVHSSVTPEVSAEDLVTNGGCVSDSAESVPSAAGLSSALKVSSPEDAKSSLSSSYSHVPSVKDMTHSSSNCSSDPQIPTNKFQNDGSFLATILEQQQREATQRLQKNGPAGTEKKRPKQCSSSVGSSDAGATSSCGTKKKRQTTVPPSCCRQCSTPSPDNKNSISSSAVNDEDPALLKAKQEFLYAMKMMEEAGLVTEKGIGAGMVK